MNETIGANMKLQFPAHTSPDRLPHGALRTAPGRGGHTKTSKAMRAGQRSGTGVQTSQRDRFGNHPDKVSVAGRPSPADPIAILSPHSTPTGVKGRGHPHHIVNNQAVRRQRIERFKQPGGRIPCIGNDDMRDLPEGMYTRIGSPGAGKAQSATIQLPKRGFELTLNRRATRLNLPAGKVCAVVFEI